MFCLYEGFCYVYFGKKKARSPAADCRRSKAYMLEIARAVVPLSILIPRCKIPFATGALVLIKRLLAMLGLTMNDTYTLWSVFILA